jgi:dihydroorotate dehydrogenase
MRWIYRHAIRPVLFTQEPEEIHQQTLAGLGWVSRQSLLCEALGALLGAPPLPVDAFGLRFPNPIGLAAGMDKEAEALPAWPALGFGFAELGAVTWHAQPGNPRPRVFRAVTEEAIVNRMGFNNAGAVAVAARLAAWRAAGRWPDQPVGINLGKSRVTPLGAAAEDYARSLQVLWPHADFFVINVSSPNTPDLRRLQDRAALDEVLAAVQEVNARCAGAASAQPGPGRPILVKVAPDLTHEALDDLLTLVEPRAVAGIVATNTTLTRPVTADPAVERVYAEAGGLSGPPLRARSTEVIRHLHRQTRGRVPIIGVGGIASAADAWEKVAAGAVLLQVYTALVFEGPGLARVLVSGLAERLRAEGFQRLSDAVGCAAG